jgi:hypothetical protein
VHPAIHGTIGICPVRLDGCAAQGPYARLVRTTLGWVVIAIGAVIVVLVVTRLHATLSRRALDIVSFATGVGVGVGGLLVVGDADTWSWIVAPLALGVGAVAQERALFASGGPFRT